MNRGDEQAQREATQQAPDYAALLAATQAVERSLSGFSGGVWRFFADGCFAVGAMTVDPLDEQPDRGVGIIVADDDPALRLCFELRDQLGDREFAAAWKVKDMRWGVLQHPTKPKALIRFAVQATLTEPGGEGHHVSRAFLLDAGQMLEPVLRRFSETGTWAWLIPASVAVREHRRQGPGSFYDAVSRCLPLGACAGGPVRAIDTALAHAREPWGR